MVFSVLDYSIWDVFPWKSFSLLYAVAFIPVAVPQARSLFALFGFSMLERFDRGTGLAPILLISLVVIPHFILTAIPLHSEKRALESGDYSIIVAMYDGRQPDRQVAWATFPETTLLFDGKQYQVPGSLHGSVDLLPAIREKLMPSQKYSLYVSGEVILQIEPLI